MATDLNPTEPEPFHRDSRGRVVLDPGGRIALSLGVAGVPESFLVAPNSVIAAKVTGGVRFDQLEALLVDLQQPLTGEDPSP